jgi:lipopolysaccharide/colanic/teichoic acid biosynthesis glycosyltransferase
LLICLAGFSLILLFLSRARGLYGPLQSLGGWREQRLTVQACLTAGLILVGGLYVAREASISRAVVIATLLSTSFLLCLRRAMWRSFVYKHYEKGIGTRNVLIIGAGPSGLAIRSHLQSISHLGFSFKGFVQSGNERLDESASEFASAQKSPSWRAKSVAGAPLEWPLAAPEILGDLRDLAELVRRHFIDEIFVTGPSDRGMVKQLIAAASDWGVDVRVMLDLYDGLAWGAPIEYVGEFPSMPLHRQQLPFIGRMLKRPLDLVISAVALVLLSPLMFLIAIAVRLDSPGPIFYCAERIGRKGRTFCCWKFRTMIVNADAMQEQLSKMNERDGVLFKIKQDPRVTRIGHFLRRYSLDELPQFFNVLTGDMSVVGPRPPLSREVRQYELAHLRRLEVLPGITGLWQVQARQDPSFDQYISLDTAYVDNWSLWLDMKIMAKTAGVVLSGTGS